MSKKICEECLIKAICIDTCEDFEYPEGNEIFYFLESKVRLNRLKNHHRKNGRHGIYDLGGSEFAKVEATGVIYGHDSRLLFTIWDKYCKIRKEHSELECPN